MRRTIPIKQLTSWSFSRYNDYTTCPLKTKLKHLDKITEPPNDAMARGTEVHTIAEHYLKGVTARLPAVLKPLGDEFKRLKKLNKKRSSGMAIEESWAFTKDWTETVWNDWAGCWVRIKLDCAHPESDDTVMVITDWKTGKFRPEKNEEYVEQLELYALAALIKYPHVTEVRPRLGYVDQGLFYPRADEENNFVYTHDDVPRLKKLWAKRTKAMLSDKRFAPKPNNLCNWCFYRASNKEAGGGQCKF